MATKKKKGFFITLMVLLAVAVWWKFFRKLTDKDGNTFVLDRSSVDSTGDYQVLVNDVPNGHLLALRKGSDGYVHGPSKDGRNFIYVNGWRAE